MSNIKENLSINIYNQNDFNLSVVTDTRSVFLEPCKNGVPTMDRVSYNELAFVNSHSNAIRSGLIMFDDDKKYEIYEALGIGNPDLILTNAEIKDILLNPTIEGLEKILSNTDQSVFDRVRCILVFLLNSGEEDVSVRVKNIISEREKEFRRGELVTRIKLNKKDEKPLGASKEVEDLRSQNKELVEQMKNMQAMIEALVAQNKASETENKPKKTRAKKAATEPAE